MTQRGIASATPNGYWMFSEQRSCPSSRSKEVHRPDMVDFGRELDGAEGIHCIEDSPYTDYAKLTYPIQGEYLISKGDIVHFSELT